MFWVRFWSFIMGYLTILVEGKDVEKLVNMAVSRGIYLWDIRWIGPEKVLIKARVSSFRALRHIIRRTGGQMKIKEKKGLPFKTAKLLKRQMMLAGAIASIAILYILSSFIWFVEVTGNKNVPAEVILSRAEKSGLHVGTAKWKLNSSRVEKNIINELPNLSWVGVNVIGTKAIIKVAEKTEAPVKDDSPANIVADKSGLVEEVLVLAGVAATNEGKMVKKGDLLISGIISTELDPPAPNPTVEEESEPEKILKQRYVRARGIIKARVWYEGYGEAELVSRREVKTGRSSRMLTLKLGNQTLTLQGTEKVSYGDYTKTERVKRLPAWRNIRIPVELITTYYYETKVIEEKVNRSEATDRAIGVAKQQVQGMMPQQAKVLDEKLNIISTDEPNLVRVRITIETQENIGVVKPIDKREMQYGPFQQDQEGRHN